MSRCPQQADASRTDRSIGVVSAWTPLARFSLIASLIALSSCSRPPVIPPPPGNPLTIRVISNPVIPADLAFDQGDYATAVADYRRMLQGTTEESVDGVAVPVDRELVLYRMALMHALPGSLTHDPREARNMLSLLREEFPGTTRDREIEALLDLDTANYELENVVEGLQTAIGFLQDRMVEWRSRELEFESDRRDQDAVISDLRRTIGHLEQQLQASQTELEKLKEIDLGRRPIN